MAKGRNTSVISVRLVDETVNRLKTLARKRRITMTELLTPVIGNFAFRGRVSDVKFVVEAPPDKELQDNRRITENVSDIDKEISEPLGLEKYTDYRKSPEPKRTEKFPGTPRNAPCPCGALHPDGRPKKYKHCCGKTG